MNSTTSEPASNTESSFESGKATPLRCTICGSEEGQVRMVGNYTVHIKTINVSGKQRHACQSCARKHWKIVEERRLSTRNATESKENKLRDLIRSFGFMP